MVGVGSREKKSRFRVVRVATRDVMSHDEILQVKSSRCCSLGKRERAKKSEMSTNTSPPLSRMNDSTLLGRISSEVVVNIVMRDLRGSVFVDEFVEWCPGWHDPGGRGTGWHRKSHPCLCRSRPGRVERYQNGDAIGPSPSGRFPRNSKHLGLTRRPRTSDGKRGGSCAIPSPAHQSHP